jgi:hypothetical protein
MCWCAGDWQVGVFVCWWVGGLVVVELASWCWKVGACVLMVLALASLGGCADVLVGAVCSVGWCASCAGDCGVGVFVAVELVSW